MYLYVYLYMYLDINCYVYNSPSENSGFLYISLKAQAPSLEDPWLCAKDSESKSTVTVQ